MKISELNIFVGILGTLIGMLISVLNYRNQEKRKLKDDTIALANIESDIKFIKSATEKNSAEISKVNESIVLANEKIARIEERVNIYAKRE